MWQSTYPNSIRFLVADRGIHNTSNIDERGGSHARIDALVILVLDLIAVRWMQKPLQYPMVEAKARPERVSSALALRLGARGAAWVGGPERSAVVLADTAEDG